MPDQTTLPTAKKPTVFISYSHVDEVWKNRLRPHLGALENAGRIAVWDDRKIDAGDAWYPEIKTAMDQAAVAICLISPDFLNSAFCVKEEVLYFLQRRERDGLVIIPVLLHPCPWKAIDWLKEIQMLPRDGKSVAINFRGRWNLVSATVAERILEVIDNPDYKPPAPPAPVWAMPQKINIARMPVTGSDLFGRAEELKLLDEAWASPQTNIISLVAYVGVSKSTLVNRSLERMKADNYRGARRVYAWSFYSQGTSERATSADQFINPALEWVGDVNPLAGSPLDKGERLAKLVRQEKTLLLLDGMEPLQSPHNHERGKIKDPALPRQLNGQNGKVLALSISRWTVSRWIAPVCSNPGNRMIAITGRRRRFCNYPWMGRDKQRNDGSFTSRSAGACGVAPRDGPIPTRARRSGRSDAHRGAQSDALLPDRLPHGTGAPLPGARRPRPGRDRARVAVIRKQQALATLLRLCRLMCGKSTTCREW